MIHSTTRSMFENLLCKKKKKSIYMYFIPSLFQHVQLLCQMNILAREEESLSECMDQSKQFLVSYPNLTTRA